MNGIKIILLTAFAAILVWAFRNRRRVGLRAGGRVAAVAVAALAVVSVLFPEWTLWLAHRVGVTRGTDLVLYLFIVVVVVTSVGTYFRFAELDRRLVEIVRANAIREAVLNLGLPGDDPAAAPDPGEPGP